MEMKSIRRFLVLTLSVITIMASSMGVFAADTSPSGGNTKPDPVITGKATSIDTKTGKTTVRYTAKNAVEYQIQYKMKSAKYWVTKKTKSNSYALNLKLKGLYQIRVRAISKDGKKSSWSKIMYRYIRGTTPTYSTPKTKSIQVKAPKSSYVTGYLIYYSAHKNMTNAKKITVKKKSVNSTIGVVKGKTYYIKVIPILESDGHIYYGDGYVKAVKAK